MQCCPKSAETCNGRGCFSPGSLCCSNHGCNRSGSCCGTGCCDQGEECCLEKACCRPGTRCCARAEKCCLNEESCCPGACMSYMWSTSLEHIANPAQGCPPGYVCGKESGTCRKIVTSKIDVSPAPTTRHKTSTTSAEPELETPDISDDLVSSSSSTAPSEESACSLPSQKRAAGDVSSLKRIESIYAEKEYEPFSDIALSICLGMKSRGVVGSQEVLTYAGSKDECYKQRRREARCRDFCKGTLH
jgi:hypothetical protein